MDPARLEQEAERLQRRANYSRMFGWIGVAVMIATVISMIFLFFNTGADLYIPFGKFEAVLGSDESSAYAQSAQDNSDIAKMRLELDLQKTKLLNEQQSSTLLITVISSSVARIGAVLIALYLVQILLSLTRYHFRIADHLDSAASALTISRGGSETLVPVSQLLSTNHIEFGKSPSAPTEKVLELMKDIIQKK